MKNTNRRLLFRVKGEEGMELPVMRYLKVTGMLLLLITALSFGYVRVYADEYYSIEPGWRVGPILLNMTKENVIAVYGEGEWFEVPDPEGSAKMQLLQYKQMGLDIVFKNRVIDFIEIKLPCFTIKDNIRVGSSVEKVLETMGNTYIRENYRHSYEPDIPEYMMKYRGITFHVKGGRVIKMTLTRIP